MSSVLVRMEGVSRRFGPVAALRSAHLELRAGEVHGVLGENGAGKSTLLGVLGGLVRPDGGVVEVSGRVVDLRSPRDAWAHGIGLVHQHFTLVPRLSVLENLALGRRSASGGWRLPYDAIRAEATAWASRTGLDVQLDSLVEELGVGDRQRVEILRTLLRDPPILALDEPTATLTPSETESLFGLLRELASSGRSVVLVAHKIDEVLGVADRVTVLRSGRTVLSAPRDSVGRAALIRAMVGFDVETGATSVTGRLRVAHEEEGPTAVAGIGGGVEREVVASLEGVSALGASGQMALDGVWLTVRRGEIVGIAGVEGNGQRELARVLTGRLKPLRGRVEAPVGVGFVPQDRTNEGLIGSFDLAENVALALHDDPRVSHRGILRWTELRSHAEAIRTRFEVRAPSISTLAATLSGGNQQRLLLGRELMRSQDLLVAENPTRGLDVAAESFVHAELVRISSSDAGPGIVLLSTDLDEVLAISTRILVMSRGRLLPLGARERTREAVGALMLDGGDPEGRSA